MKRTLLSLLAVVLIVLIGRLLWPVRSPAPSAAPPAASADPFDAAAPGPVSAPALDADAPRVPLEFPASDALPPARVPRGGSAGELRVHCLRLGQPSVGVPVLVLRAAGGPWQQAEVAPTDARGIAAFQLAAEDYLCTSLAGGRSAGAVRAGTTTAVELAIAPDAVAVRGAVIDDAGRPLADVEVTAATADSRALVAVARSDAEGAFVLPAVAPGVRLGAWHPQFGAAPLQTVTAQPSGACTLTWHLGANAAVLRGIVVDAQDAPIAGAQLWFATDDADDAPAHRQVTGTDGRFAAAAPRTGRTALRVQATGFQPLTTAIDAASAPAKELRIRLAAGASVRGRVLDRDGQPCVGATVLGGGAPRAFGSRTTTTEGDGSYRLTDLPTGRVTIQAWLAPDQLARGEIVCTAGSDAALDLRLQRIADGVVRGTFVDADARPVAGARVFAIDRQRALRTGTHTTDAAGAFALAGFPAGTAVQVLAFAPADDESGFPAATADAVVGDPPLRLQGTAEAARPGTLLGRVLAPDGSGAVAQVELWHPGRGQRARYRTAGDGSFRLERIPAGSLRLAVRHDRFAADPPRTVDLPPGGVLDLGALNLQPGFVIHGALRGPDDQALPQVTVCVRQGGREVGYAAVAADGSYRCPPLRPGDYTLQVQAEGLAPGFAAVTLDAADRLLDLRLTWGIPVHALVQAADGPAGRWTSLRVLDERNQPLHDAGLPMADRTTRYPLWLAPGRYRAFAADDLGHRAAAEWTIVQGQSPAPLLLQLR